MENIYECSIQGWKRHIHATQDHIIAYSLEHIYFINRTANNFYTERSSDPKATLVLMLLLLEEAEYREDRLKLEDKYILGIRR